MLARLLVSHGDISMLLLKRLTVQEAGRLGGACRAAHVLVRRGEAEQERFIEELRWRREQDAQYEMCAVRATQVSEEEWAEEALEVHRETTRWAEKHQLFLPMWNIDHVLARLERYRQPFGAGGAQWRETRSLARLLVNGLQAHNVIELRFDVHSARSGQKPSLLGCHELRVMPFCSEPWVKRLRNWAIGECCPDGMHGLITRQARRRHPGTYMFDLLCDLGLKPSGALFMPAFLPDDWEEELMDCRQLCHMSWVPTFDSL
jgi:hypothetical protein